MHIACASGFRLLGYRIGSRQASRLSHIFKSLRRQWSSPFTFHIDGNLSRTTTSPISADLPPHPINDATCRLKEWVFRRTNSHTPLRQAPHHHSPPPAEDGFVAASEKDHRADGRRSKRPKSLVCSRFDRIGVLFPVATDPVTPRVSRPAWLG